MKKLFGLLILLTLLTIPLAAAAESELSGKYMTIVDQKNRMITQTGHEVVVGDEYLNSANKLYRVYRVKGDTAVAKLVRQRKMAQTFLGSLKSFVGQVADFIQTEVRGRGPVAIYHTHTDESYQPSDGTSSRAAKGGIFDVGDSLTNAFEKIGVPAIHSRTPHDPHDAMAYDRSRRTAVQLLKNRPSTLLDVHRDATPPSAYLRRIGNQELTMIQLVVGRQNPNFQTTNNFARQIKTTVDRKYPGLIKGIFYGRGKYNQDLGPRTMLLEFGSNTTTKPEAERAASLFATASQGVLYGNVGRTAMFGGSIRNLLWILIVLTVGAGIYIFLNRGGLKNLSKEYTGAMGEDRPETEKEKEATESDQNGES